MRESKTPRTDQILDYLAFQFPATAGHIPLRKMLEGIEEQLAAAIAERDELRSQLSLAQTHVDGLQNDCRNLRQQMEEITRQFPAEAKLAESKCPRTEADRKDF